MMFHDRIDAGKQLAKKLLKYRNKKTIVLAIPRSGVPVGYEIAKVLKAEFDLLVSRKLPFPYNPEAGFGAISETGNIVLTAYMPKEEITKIKEEQLEEIKRRIKVLRKGRTLNLEGKIAILVDDGLAMGSTMEVSVMTAKKMKASKVVVAVPTAGYEVIKRMKNLADEVICPDTRKYFIAVADAYENWYDLTDKEVLEIMKSWKQKKTSTN